jgi:hypothetical protein
MPARCDGCLLIQRRTFFQKRRQHRLADCVRLVLKIQECAALERHRFIGRNLPIQSRLECRTNPFSGLLPRPQCTHGFLLEANSPNRLSIHAPDPPQMSCTLITLLG